LKTKIVLSDIIPGDIFTGTSLIIRREDRFLYGIRSPKMWHGQPVLEITGIGGGLEKEDESLSTGVQREAQEEIACEVQLIPVKNTLIVHGLEDVSSQALSGEEQPAAIVYRNWRTPPHHPWHPENHGSACLVIFLGKLLGRPRPVMELPHLIWLSAEQVLESARRDITLGELLAGGAELIPGTSTAPHPENQARMTDSQEALALALGDETPSVYLGF
jgi:8-oxo-dGTP pyrophosphatase MutT (NUDIX family)